MRDSRIYSLLAINPIAESARTSFNPFIYLIFFYAQYRNASAVAKLVLLLVLYALSSIEDRAFAQKKFLLEVRTAPDEARKMSSFRYQKLHPDSLSAERELYALVRAAHTEAFLLATVDTFYWQQDTLLAELYLGQPFRWAHLSKGNLSDGLLVRSGYREKFYRNTPFRYNELVKLEDRLVTYAENNGYPFARIALDSIELTKQTIGAALKYEEGPVVVFDTIRNLGNAAVASKFLSRYLRIYPGEPFSQQKLTAAYRILQQTPYLKVSQLPLAIFSNNRAEVELVLDKRKVNQIDGIIGFLPNEEEKNKVLITGELNLHLQNLFSSGKALRAQWQKLKTASQRLDLEYVHPAFLGTPIEVKGNFNLLKEDTAFLNTVGRLSLGYQTNNSGKVGFYTSLAGSRLLSAPTNTFQAAALAGYQLSMYGLTHEWNNLDDYFYPRSGWRFYTEGAAGNKRLKKPLLKAGEESAYDTLKLQSLQFNLAARAEKYTRLSARSVLLTAMKSGLLMNENIFLNDLYRLGGLNTLRGFNENNFFASRFGVATLEYRFFMEEASYLLLFYDHGYIYYELAGRTHQDFPMGLGAGISFSTPAGIFNFVYSLGKSNEQNLVFNQSKIHFGLINRF